MSESPPTDNSPIVKTKLKAESSRMGIQMPPVPAQNSAQEYNRQQSRLAQGCQAIFAGFVASAHLHNVSSR